MDEGIENVPACFYFHKFNFVDRILSNSFKLILIINHLKKKKVLLRRKRFEPPGGARKWTRP